MNRAELVERIADQIMSARAHPGGIVGIMLDAEIKAGGVPYDPGPEWAAGVIVRRGDEVRLVAILAKQPGQGALRRLVDRIQAEGLRPVVIEPVGLTMVAIMKRWGWYLRQLEEAKAQIEAMGRDLTTWGIQCAKAENARDDAEAQRDALVEARRPFVEAARSIRPDDPDNDRPAIVQVRHFRALRTAHEAAAHNTGEAGE